MGLVRVYKYGASRPLENAERVASQMSLAHRYRNDLVAIERARRAVVREIVGSVGDIPGLTKILEEKEQAEVAAAKAIKVARASTRSRSETADARAALKQAKAERGQARDNLQAARFRLRDDKAINARLDEVNARAVLLSNGARAICGLYWGTYLLKENAMDAARKAPLYDGQQPNDPGFDRWDGNEQVGVQLQGGILTSEAFGDDTQLQIEHVDERAWLSPIRGERRDRCRTFLKLRVGSDEKRKPIWAKWRIHMHRSLPEHARIKAVTVSRRMIGPRDTWSVEITVSLDQAQFRPSCGQGIVAIDVGWRQIGKEMRIACWLGEDGKSGEVRLSEEVLSSLTYPERLQSIRKKNFDQAKTALLAWLNEHSAKLPEWLREEKRYLHMWESQARLAKLTKYWEKHRFAGDATGEAQYKAWLAGSTKEHYAGPAAGYIALEAWRYQDHHLWLWETSQRTKSQRWRREIYRIVAADLSRRYGAVALEEFDLSDVAVHPPIEATDVVHNDTARANRVLAAVSVFRGAVENAFLCRGGSVIDTNAVNSTRECHSCHHIEKFDAHEEISHTCPKCKRRWDQDENAEINLLARAQYAEQVRKETAATAEPKKPRESRWERVARLKREKGQRQSESMAAAPAE